jgi:hypothetical protein
MTESEKKQEEQQKEQEKPQDKVKKPRSPAQIESMKKAVAAHAANAAKKKGEAQKPTVNVEKPDMPDSRKKEEPSKKNAPKPKKKLEIKLGKFRFL